MVTTGEREKMLECIWERVERVGSPLFMEILFNAANAMLDDIKRSVNYPNGYVSRSTLFDSHGKITETGRCYVRLEFKKMIPGELRGRTSGYDLQSDLASVFDVKILDFFENERVVTEKLRQKSQDAPP